MSASFAVYYRVSRPQQGESGLGLEAQQRDVAQFIAATGAKIVGEFRDFETGANDDREGLKAAKQRCRETGARILVAKQDRISRDAHFVLGLRKEGYEFVACDAPGDEFFAIGIKAVMSQHERELIALRTKNALQSIKVRIAAGETHVSKRSGRVVTRLGNPNGLAIAAGSEIGVAAIKAKADSFAGSVAPTARALMATEGSLAKVATRLNELGVKTARGSTWTPMAVSRVLARSQAMASNA